MPTSHYSISKRFAAMVENEEGHTGLLKSCGPEKRNEIHTTYFSQEAMMIMHLDTSIARQSKVRNVL